VNRLVRFARFWYDFVVGDDWTIAVAVVVILAIAGFVADRGRVAWPIVPIGVAAVLSASVGRVLRGHQRATRELRETENP
jgi:hypothetical protein